MIRSLTPPQAAGNALAFAVQEQNEDTSIKFSLFLEWKPGAERPRQIEELYQTRISLRRTRRHGKSLVYYRIVRFDRDYSVAFSSTGALAIGSFPVLFFFLPNHWLSRTIST